MTDAIVVRGAAEHNLQQVDVEIPRNCLAVVTGLSGSGKSSLAYDVIFREGQRRFVESLSAYARQYLGKMDKPRVEHIEGLSPTISIDQKTISRNPRSTVGTITEILDHLRLLFARLGTPHCPECNRTIESQTVDQIVESAYQKWEGADVLVCAPIVLDRKGEYRKELEELRGQGFVRVRVDGRVRRLDEDITLARYERHTIEVVYDRLRLTPDRRSRFSEAVEKTLEIGSGLVDLVIEEETSLFSSTFSCPKCSISIPELEPRLFSFNSAHGACVRCDGLGRAWTVDLDRLIPDPSLSIAEGAIATTTRAGQIRYSGLTVDDLASLEVDVETPWQRLDDDVREGVLFGAAAPRRVLSAQDSKSKRHWRNRRKKKKQKGSSTGVVTRMERAREKGSRGLEKWFRFGDCPSCRGSRLRPETRSVLFRDRSIDEYCRLTVAEAREVFADLDLTAQEAPVGDTLITEIRHRLEFLDKVGLGYLAVDRSGDTLSGGEAQRIRLASQLGSGLRGVLYVLDEPSIGLHPRDNSAMLDTLRHLRDLGNSVLVVEHDLETIEAADYVVDVGPEAGVHGGRIVGQGPVTAIREASESITGRYLTGAASIPVPASRRTSRGTIRVLGARQHNLQSIDVAFPLGVLSVVTGVSGSGKSSLVHDVLFRAALEALGRETEPPGPHDGIEGLDAIDKVIEIDQSPIGRTPRSNPGTYTKVFDEIRGLYSNLPESKVRGYSKGRFSFNVKGGRCEGCGGAGVNVISMQFLADVEVVCEECEGRRYNPETLEVTYRGLSIDRVLDMPIDECAEFFRDHPKISRTLVTLVDVGLGYVKLGQPSTTLSGGEAQRVKLADELRKTATGRTLYLLDEPTTGLHFEDVRRLLETLQRLVDQGNWVIVVEHNLDVIKVADHVIDLGPEGGAGGGTVVGEGLPESIAKLDTPTGHALRETFAPRKPRRGSRKGKRKGGAGQDPTDRFVIHGAREHNLKNISLEIPRGQLTVITGPSGSGKSTLAFDILFAEGQRRYVESLSTYARRFLGRMDRAEVDRVEGIAPAIAIDQKSRSSSPRSTVATSTEIYDYLRLLYARIGIPHCPSCDEVLHGSSPSIAAGSVVEEFGDEAVYLLAPLFEEGRTHGALQNPKSLLDEAPNLVRDGFVRALVDGREVRLEEISGETAGPLAETREVHLVIDRLKPSGVARSRLTDSIEEAYRRGFGTLVVRNRGGDQTIRLTELASCRHGHFLQSEPLTPRLFSFNHHSGACPQCDGLGHRRRVEPELLFTDPDLPLFEGAMDHRVGRWVTRPKGRVRKVIQKAFDELGLDLARPVKKLTKKARQVLFEGTGDRVYRVRFRSMVRGIQTESNWEGLDALFERWHGRAESSRWRRALEEHMARLPCSRCGGGRLRPDLLAVRVGGRAIHEVTALSVGEARDHFGSIELPKRALQIADEILREIRHRLDFLVETGLGYVTLDRVTETLSGGEAQRIRLATQIGNRLVGVLYVLDEPTIGLHQRDNERLLQSLLRLRDLGNSVVVVEHDQQTIEAADHVIELGPEAGRLGGEIVASGTPDRIRRHRDSTTGAFLSGRRRIERRTPRREGDGGTLEILGAAANNLSEIDVTIPTGTLTTVTGVSGSGKSSLVMDILARAARRHFHGAAELPGPHREIRGFDHFEFLSIIDQTAIGRSPSSNPATYTKIFDAIRELFSRTAEARARGYAKGRFSFNMAGGRCENCEGKGSILVEMHFLSDVWLPCEVCRGRRYNSETLQIRYKGKTIADVLDMEVDEAVELFADYPKIAPMVQTLSDVGLGYVALGQSATTLSGGEAQRVKLAAELGRTPRGRGLYLLDEPTTGLHFTDVEKLVNVLDRLVERGDTVVVIEHNIDVIRCADHVIDLGPEGGDGGGRVVAAGPPKKVARCRRSHTGRFLQD